jgi:hypothetical protein
MPRVKGQPATQEEYEEWLGRLEEEEPLPDTYDEFVRMLRGELQMADGSTLDYNDTQIDKLWEMKGVEADLGEHGIRGINIKYPWGNERRYGVQGMSGLFGWKSIQTIRGEEGW